MKLIHQLRKNLRDSTLDALGLFAKPIKGIHILNGHTIHRTKPDMDIFLSQLKEMQKFSTFIKIEEAVNLISLRKNVNDVLIAFTFDDGFEECASMIAPALEQFGTNGMFFINPNFVDGDEKYILNFTENVVLSPGKRPMRWNDVIKLHTAGHLIGAHTLDHYMINSEDASELNHQIADCKTRIEHRLNSPCDYFAFPFGRIEHSNPLSIDIALRNYKYVFSQSNYKYYFSYNGKVINRRHFEPYWPIEHVKYFISHLKRY